MLTVFVCIASMTYLASGRPDCSCCTADVVSGVQGSLQSLLHMTTFAAALLCSRFRAFPWLMAASCAAALAGLLFASNLLAYGGMLAIASDVVPIFMQPMSEAASTWCAWCSGGYCQCTATSARNCCSTAAAEKGSQTCGVHGPDY